MPDWRVDFHARNDKKVFLILDLGNINQCVQFIQFCENIYIKVIRIAYLTWVLQILKDAVKSLI